MALYRFYVAAFSPPVVGLPEDQSHHALHVLRLEAGTPVVVFDGRGGWAEGKFRPEKRGTFVDLTSDVHQDPAPALQLTLAVAVPKADRAEWLIEQASQLGAATVQWLDTERGVVKPKESGHKIDKYRRIAMESAKQCHRTHLLTIAPMRSLEEVLRDTPAMLLWLDPRATQTLAQLPLPQAGRITALIGPEGGWSKREEDLVAATAGVVPIRLTPTVLRIETAAAAVAALVMAR